MFQLNVELIVDVVHSIRAITDKQLRNNIALLQKMLLKREISRINGLPVMNKLLIV